ncbi:MAG: GNAT family N-acetyltransferase [Ferrimicrobium sp.]|nr:GNAT family N-acetyltransferase [Ferrimicrobium sp.]
MSIEVVSLAHIPADFEGWLDGEDALREPSAFVVAHYEGVPAGLLAINVVGTNAEITFHYVEPELRDLSIGESLLEEAIAFARQSGCSTCTGWVRPGDRIAKLTYEAQGFRAERIRVVRAL